MSSIESTIQSVLQVFKVSLEDYDTLRPRPSMPILPLPQSPMDLAPYIDHTILKADASPESIIKLCKEAAEYKFASVCINSCFVSLAKKELSGTKIKICTVIGFPLGAMSTAAKIAETRIAIEDGADEIDMVIQVGLLKAQQFDVVYHEIKDIKSACNGKLLKVIIENAYLSDTEKIQACVLSKLASADFVKTSTGFAASGATIEDVELMRQVVGTYYGVKAAGGIRDTATAMAMVNAGATRIGASAGISIIKG